MFDAEFEPAIAQAFERAIAAVAGESPGSIDDLVLLEGILSDADDDLLRALGSRARQLLKDATAERQRRDLGAVEYAFPDAEDVQRFAAMEASELMGYGATVGGIHVLLALFAFQGSGSEAVLRRGGVDWRPLRSVMRRLGMGGW